MIHLRVLIILIATLIHSIQPLSLPVAGKSSPVTRVIEDAEFDSSQFPYTKADLTPEWAGNDGGKEAVAKMRRGTWVGVHVKVNTSRTQNMS